MEAMSDGDVSMETIRHYRLLANRVLDKLHSSYIDACFASDHTEALSCVVKFIHEKASIGIGDSITLHQIGFFDWLSNQGDHQVFNPFIWDDEGHIVYTRDEQFELMRKALTADVFVASANAITLRGEVISVDGYGNRVAPTIFGPRKVVLVIGANKIVRDVEAGLARVREVCAPLNAIRHAEKHHAKYMNNLPCVNTGFCTNCESSARICRKTVIISGQSPEFFATKEEGLSVVLVGESLGI
jgi:hypothetical protein